MSEINVWQLGGGMVGSKWENPQTSNWTHARIKIFFPESLGDKFACRGGEGGEAYFYSVN